MTRERKELTKARRIVVKIGSSSLARDPEAHARLARAVKSLAEAGRSVVIVSSGAIALGTRKLGYRARPKEMARLQAAAAAIAARRGAHAAGVGWLVGAEGVVDIGEPVGVAVEIGGQFGGAQGAVGGDRGA